MRLKKSKSESPSDQLNTGTDCVKSKETLTATAGCTKGITAEVRNT